MAKQRKGKGKKAGKSRPKPSESKKPSVETAGSKLLRFLRAAAPIPRYVVVVIVGGAVGVLTLVERIDGKEDPTSKETERVVKHVKDLDLWLPGSKTFSEPDAVQTDRNGVGPRFDVELGDVERSNVYSVEGAVKNAQRLAGKGAVVAGRVVNSEFRKMPYRSGRPFYELRLVARKKKAGLTGRDMYVLVTEANFKTFNRKGNGNVGLFKGSIVANGPSKSAAKSAYMLATNARGARAFETADEIATVKSCRVHFVLQASRYEAKEDQPRCSLRIGRTGGRR